MSLMQERNYNGGSYSTSKATEKNQPYIGTQGIFGKRYVLV
jgi:hypothetical protein